MKKILLAGVVTALFAPGLLAVDYNRNGIPDDLERRGRVNLPSGNQRTAQQRLAQDRIARQRAAQQRLAQRGAASNLPYATDKDRDGRADYKDRFVDANRNGIDDRQEGRLGAALPRAIDKDLNGIPDWVEKGYGAPGWHREAYTAAGINFAQDYPGDEIDQQRGHKRHRLLPWLGKTIEELPESATKNKLLKIHRLMVEMQKRRKAMRDGGQDAAGYPIR